MASRLKFKTVEELQNRIDEYFKYAETKGKPLTIAGLAYFLDVHRDTIYEYEKQKDILPEYSDAVKKARDRILLNLEESILESNRKNVTGPIFIAKNYGYKDHNDRDTGPINVTVEFKHMGK